MSADNLVGQVSSILLSRSSDKPWMTATGLSGTSKKNTGALYSLRRSNPPSTSTHKNWEEGLDTPTTLENELWIFSGGTSLT